MDNIGPFTFNAVRFFVGFLAIVPLAFLFEVKKFKSEFKLDFKTFAMLSFLIGLSLFLGSALQQVALLYTDVANAAFFTIFYVPMVPFIIFIMNKKTIHWSIWPSVGGTSGRGGRQRATRRGGMRRAEGREGVGGGACAGRATPREREREGWRGRGGEGGGRGGGGGGERGGGGGR